MILVIFALILFFTGIGVFAYYSSKNKCSPNCNNKTCGDDGCGGSCGICTSLRTCVNGTCVCPVPNVVINGVCQSCPSNAFPNSDYTGCISCTGNQVLNSTRNGCTSCTGFLSVPNYDNSRCIQCSTGQVANATNTECRNCVPDSDCGINCGGCTFPLRCDGWKCICQQDNVYETTNIILDNGVCRCKNGYTKGFGTGTERDLEKCVPV